MQSTAMCIIFRPLAFFHNVDANGNAIYVILDAELQDKVHYGMSVKDGMYDMLGYSRQIAEIKRPYKNDSIDEDEIIVENGVLKIKLNCDEFLSGLKNVGLDGGSMYHLSGSAIFV